ncbi:MAG TPA: DUF1501 domain-containing protein [Thermoanaerobaculia bacterium]|nr:DUF1501 domain-containing protein [Thermoanaerobaculia bacterium]
MAISRRDFLLRSAGFVSVSAMVPRWAVAGTKVFEESVGAEAAGRTLVVLELMGGNDGLNTVIPYTDPAYPQVRSRIGISQASTLPLDSRLGLNPVMTGIKSLWDKNRVALIENVGYPNSSLSHFTSRDIWHTADPALAQRRGWLGRWADAAIGNSDNPLSCAAISQTLPRTLLADSVSVPSFVNLASYTYTTDGTYPGDRNNQLNTFLLESSDEYEIENTMSEVTALGTAAMSSSTILQSVSNGYVAGGQYPAGTLGAGLLLIAQIINANVGARILYVTFGGFDNHANEDNDHDGLLQNVSDGVKAFFDDLDAHGKAHDVLLMMWSEFGRRVQDNASRGTDHGTSAPHFVVGDAVKPGIYGGPPNLTSLDSNGNLKIENDFRSYYGTILSDWLKADANAILGSWPNLGFVNKGYV